MPVYDAALDFLASHRDNCAAQYERLTTLPSPSAAEMVEADNWEVDGFVNDPATRALFRETKGAGQMHRPVMRHLAERSWKNQGGLDLIMGRVYQNKVVPDVIPDLAPLNPLTFAVKEGVVEPGLTIKPSLIEDAPTIYYQPFQHPSTPSKAKPNPTALYTLVAVDPDTPDSVNHTFTQRLHYLKTDIPLSVTTGETPLIQSSLGKELVAWEPLAPPRNTPKHRLVFILLRQHNNRPSKLTTPPPRENFNVRSLMATFDFPLNSIVGVNLIKSEWTEDQAEYINKIWKEHRGKDKAPVYTRVAQEVRYGKPLNSLHVRAEAIRERAWQRSLEEFERETGVGIVEDFEAEDGVTSDPSQGPGPKKEE
jgi:large subunit ribosomal protein L35